MALLAMLSLGDVEEEKAEWLRERKEGTETSTAADTSEEGSVTMDDRIGTVTAASKLRRDARTGQDTNRGNTWDCLQSSCITSSHS